MNNIHINVINVNSPRPYAMETRAAAAQQTRDRVLDAAVHLLRAGLRSDIRLGDIADRADVTVQTVLRLYGSRDRLLDRALDVVLGDIARQLGSAEPGDIAGSVRTWFDHYEEYGDVVIRNLADEEGVPAVRDIVRTGRRRHRDRVTRQFQPLLRGLAPDARQRVTDALVCTCDVYTWKLLRRDMGRTRQAAEETMTLMITSVLEGG